MHKRQTGNTLSEYGIILTLLGLLTVPALMFIGNRQHDGFQNTANAITNNTDMAVGALRNKNQPGSGSSGVSSNPQGGNSPAGSKGAAGTGVNAAGQMNQPGNADVMSGNGAQTTSVEGTTMLAKNLDAIANNWVDPTTGQPLPAAIRNSILQLAQDGQQLAKTESQPGANKNTLTSQSNQFNTDYAALNNALSSPQYASLKAAVDNNASGISQISGQTIAGTPASTPTPVYATPTSTLSASGSPTTTTTGYTSPATTTNTTSKQPVTTPTGSPSSTAQTAGYPATSSTPTSAPSTNKATNTAITKQNNTVQNGISVGIGL